MTRDDSIVPTSRTLEAPFKKVRLFFSSKPYLSIVPSETDVRSGSHSVFFFCLCLSLSSESPRCLLIPPSPLLRQKRAAIAEGDPPSCTIAENVDSFSYNCILAFDDAFVFLETAFFSNLDVTDLSRAVR